MTIHTKDTRMVMLCLEAAKAMDKTWLLFDDNKPSLTPKDMHFFGERHEATTKIEKASNTKTNFKILPTTALLDLVKTMQQLLNENKCHDHPIEFNTDAIIHQQMRYLRTLKENYSSILKKQTMNEKNLETLKNNLKFLGFGETLQPTLEKNIREQKPAFNLQTEIEYNNRTLQLDLTFKAGEQNEMYFFNRYQATLKDHPERTQTFFLDRGNGITTKEAFNLLEGRAVNKDLTNKEGEKYNAWVQLNFNEREENGNYKLQRYHENYNYDLNKEISQLTLKPLDEKEMKALQGSLLKGNLQHSTFLSKGEEVKLFIEANPKERTINLYDTRMKPLTKQEKQDYVDLPSPNKEQKLDAESGAEGDPALKKKRSRKQTKGQSI